MKLISLNTYGGRFFDNLMEFIRQNSQDTDIFCFQELLHTPKDTAQVEQFRANFFSEISRALPNFKAIFAPVQPGAYPAGNTTADIIFGLGIFIKNNFNIQDSGDFFVVGDEHSHIPSQATTLPFKTQYLKLLIDGKILTICNVHGTAFPINKQDTNERLEQSKKILNFANNEPGEKIITGDFNLFPDTESIKMFEKNGFNNLVKDFHIASTRGSLVKQLHPEYDKEPEGFQEFADYTFVSPGIKVKNYTVPDLPLSDHLPLILEFKI